MVTRPSILVTQMMRIRRQWSLVEPGGAWVTRYCLLYKEVSISFTVISHNCPHQLEDHPHHSPGPGSYVCHNAALINGTNDQHSDALSESILLINVRSM